MKALVLAVRFLSELGLVVGAFAVGLQRGFLVAVAAAAFVGIVWGALIAPKAANRLSDPGRLVVELVLFGATAAGLVVWVSALPGVALGVVGTAAAVGVRKVAPGS